MFRQDPEPMRNGTKCCEEEEGILLAQLQLSKTCAMLSIDAEKTTPLGIANLLNPAKAENI